MMDFDRLRKANVERDVEWAKGKEVPLLFRSTEFAGEAGEVCNVIKKLERERFGWVGSRASEAQLAEELADVIICADLIAMDLGIDLSQAVKAKFNLTSMNNGLKTRL